MTTVRIAHAEPRPGHLGNGRIVIQGFLVVLADDAGRRALPIWLEGQSGGSSLSEFLRRPAEIVTADAPEQFTGRLLRAAGAAVTGVDIDVTGADIDELTADAAVTRIEVGGPAGTRHIAARLSLGLAVAAAAGAPVRVADAVMDRLAVPVAGDDLLGPFLDRVPPAGQPRPRHQLLGKPPAGQPVVTLSGRRPRYQPRNLVFADGLDRWDVDGGFLRQAGESHPQDYSAAAEGQSAILASAVAEPRGTATLGQAIFADDYRGVMVAFRGEIRTEDVTARAGLRLDILRRGRLFLLARDDHGVTLTGSHDWTRHEVTALVPDDADIIRFGIALTGPGLIALRNPELGKPEPAGHPEPARGA
jgi:bifunctional DNase/RNase